MDFNRLRWNKVETKKARSPLCIWVSGLSWTLMDLEMARLEGFEPPTAWFVARYSIQLSYRRFVLRPRIMPP